MSRSLADARVRVLALTTVAELRVVLDDIYEETAIRHLAAQRLGQFGEAGFLALQYSFYMAIVNTSGRIVALQALVRYFPLESEIIFLEALDDSSPRVRRSSQLLLKHFAERLAPKFRLCCYLPAHLRQNRKACEGDFQHFGLDDQQAIIEAIRRARFAPVLSQLVVHLHRHGQRTGNSYLARILSEAVCTFGNAAIPPIMDVLITTDRDRFSLFSALAKIDTPESWATLESFQPNFGVRQLFKWREDSERRKRGAVKRSPSVPA